MTSAKAYMRCRIFIFRYTECCMPIALSLKACISPNFFVELDNNRNARFAPYVTVVNGLIIFLVEIADGFDVRYIHQCLGSNSDS
jgi:hypothetical protein